MVGVGGEGNIDFAQRFVADSGVTFPMLWSDTFAAWRHYSIMLSSDFWLLDEAGNRIGDGPAPYDQAVVEELLADLAGAPA